MPKKLKIASIASEVDPFSKTGGLGDVAASLPKALKQLGHDVIVITPLYGKIIDPQEFGLELVKKNVSIKVGKNQKLKVNYWRGQLDKNLPIYFVENKKYFSRKQHPYGSEHENKRFFLFDIAAIKLLILLKFKADIIQCHDWHAGMIPYLLKKDFHNSSTLNKAATVFTIHNLSYQGGHNWWTGPASHKDNGRQALPGFKTKKFDHLNFAKRAIIHADLINTVSETYAQEILTKDFGEDLHRILLHRQDKLFGIVNGIDYKDYNPKTDPGLAKNYNAQFFIEGKEKNKQALQKYFKLPPSPNIPLLAMVTRFVEQKGLDLVVKIIEPLLRQNVQLIIMGAGQKQYEQFFRKIAKLYPKKFGATLKFDSKHATLAYAGADITLIPSRFEPCGLTQLISMRYGAVPVVRAIGGLSDTVAHFNPLTRKGNGFTFTKYNSYDFLIAVSRAISTYQYKIAWHQLIANAMLHSYSWELPAKKYVNLFNKAIKVKNRYE